ncbi:uncharacterized protein DUF4281 [Stackebrandtia albiflava]|uniref:Uncharacterized protein DUF4281 n=1 Tax=Stackebrandtia albiflava TaxID=406432 RepID=A0A562UQR4_9ACTN|nr:ABA4-like family protein [Stackebrandtia albiflava]TWJ07951.1 uncharacterized protein DUF4281 [Stackebrandtia albiflava]
MADTLFTLVFVLAAPFWFLMIVLPRWRWTVTIMKSPLIALPAAACYVILLVPQFGTVLTAVSRPDIEAVSALLATPEGAALGWAHFIAFDLFVGAWEYRDSRRRGVHPLVMAPILLVTILLAPLGFVLYLAVRAVWPRSRTEAAG